MLLPRKLRLRVALAFAVFGGLISFLLALVLYLTAHDLGVRLMNETLHAEMEDYIARRGRNPHSLPPATVTLLGFVHPATIGDPPIPKSILALPDGLHTVHWEDISYRVLSRGVKEERFFLLYNQTLYLWQESRFVVLLVSGMLAIVIVFSAGGWWFAGRVISPVVDLAERVRTLGLEAATPLAPHFPADELGSLAQVFDQLHDQLQAFIERERSFTADVSHELRTPLAVIQGVIEIVMDDASLSSRNAQRIERAQRAVRDMTTLIQALLLLSREEALYAQPDTLCRASNVVMDVVEKNHHLIVEKIIHLVLDLNRDVTLPVACIFLHIVVSNLIRNALSYTENGQVTIRLQENNLLVHDTGSGIRAEELSHVFQRHYKGPMSRGAGIGLSLVKRICQHCQWQITIDSHPDRGTTALLIFKKNVLLDPSLTDS